MLNNWERFLRWRHIWMLNNRVVEQEDVVLNLPKKIALKEMTKYLLRGDRENEH